MTEQEILNKIDEEIEAETKLIEAEEKAEKAKEIAEEAKEIAEESKEISEDNEDEQTWLKKEINQLKETLILSESQLQKLLVMCENQELRMSDMKKLLILKPSPAALSEATIVPEVEIPAQQKKSKEEEGVPPEARRKPVKLI